MSYHVKIESFEGPFELLLALVTQQKVKIGSISVAQVADQYLEHVQAMQDMDMDVASEFLIVASTLLAIKAHALLPTDNAPEVDGGELGQMTLEQATDLLATRIITYYQYKRVAAWLGSRMRNEAMMHPRSVGPDAEYLGLLPDYLQDVTLDGLGVVCASLMARRETFLLDAEHIAAKPIPIEVYVDSIELQLQRTHEMTFSQIVADERDTAHVVASFLAILEMYKRGMIDLRQSEPGEQINVSYVDPDRWGQLAAVDEPYADAAAQADDVAGREDDVAGREGDEAAHEYDVTDAADENAKREDASIAAQPDEEPHMEGQDD